MRPGGRRTVRIAAVFAFAFAVAVRRRRGGGRRGRRQMTTGDEISHLLSTGRTQCVAHRASLGVVPVLVCAFVAAPSLDDRGHYYLSYTYYMLGFIRSSLARVGRGPSSLEWV